MARLAALALLVVTVAAVAAGTASAAGLPSRGGPTPPPPDTPPELESLLAYRSQAGLPPGSALAARAREPVVPLPAPPPLGSTFSAAGGGLPSPAGAALSGPRSSKAPTSDDDGEEHVDPAALDTSAAGRGVWDIAVDASATRQAFQGFGTSLAWWANIVGRFPDAIRNRVLDLVFSREKGLGFQVARYNIGGSGWATPDAPNLRPGGNVASFLAPDGKTYDWSQDPGQRWVLLAARDRGARTFEAFSNSPPYFMTKSGRASGGPDPKADNLAPANYTAFATYLSRVVRHFGDEYGLRFTTLDPFNEPSTDYWRAGNVQEGCHFERDSQWAFLPVLSKALKSAGAGGVAVATSDETNIADADKTFKAMTPAALKLVTQINTHTYWGPTYPRPDLGPRGAAAAGKRLWMSEYGAGAFPPDRMGDALGLAAGVTADLNAMGAAAWVYWQAVENLDGPPPTPWWGLAQLNFSDGSGLRVGKQFWAAAQFSRHIPAGSTILASPKPGEVLIALVPDDALDAASAGGSGPPPGGWPAPVDLEVEGIADPAPLVWSIPPALGSGNASAPLTGLAKPPPASLVLVLTNPDGATARARIDAASFLGDGGGGEVAATRTTASEDGARAGSITVPPAWKGAFELDLAPESVTTLVVRRAGAPPRPPLPAPLVGLEADEVGVGSESTPVRPPEAPAPPAAARRWQASRDAAAPGPAADME